MENQNQVSHESNNVVKNRQQERETPKIKVVGIYERTEVPWPHFLPILNREMDAEILLDFICVALYRQREEILAGVVAKESDPFRAQELLQTLALAEMIYDACSFATEIDENKQKGQGDKPTRLQLLACCPSLAMKAANPVWQNEAGKQPESKPAMTEDIDKPEFFALTRTFDEVREKQYDEAISMLDGVWQLARNNPAPEVQALGRMLQAEEVLNNLSKKIKEL